MTKVTSVKCKKCNEELVPKLYYLTPEEASNKMDLHDKINHPQSYLVETE